MSQPELLAVLRAARPAAPPELRERVRLLAADAAPPAGLRPSGAWLTWRRALAVAVPVAAAVAAAAVVLVPRGGSHLQTIESRPPAERAAVPAAAGQGAVPAGAATKAAPQDAAPFRALPAPGPRPQRYSASLDLRLRDAAAVSAASRRATSMVAALGGYPTSLSVDAAGRTGAARLVYRVPRPRVQTAVARLSTLGTIVGEDVRIQDLGGQVDATSRTIARLRTQRAELLKVVPQTPETQHRIAALTGRIQKLRRGRAATLRTASLATVTVGLSTPPKAIARPAATRHGPLHGLGVALRWVGIGALYALALGLPLVLLGALCWLVARAARRRREDALLSRP
jgi:hypothetical protein